MSFSFHLSRIQIELSLVMQGKMKFNDECKLVPSCKKEASKKKVLKNALSVLNKAPLYHLNKEKVEGFIEVLKKYSGNDNAIYSTTKKITALVMVHANSVSKCFTGTAAQHINSLLDKKADKLTQEEYDLLFYLSNTLALRAVQAYGLFQTAAALKRIDEIKAENPNLKLLSKGIGYHFSVEPIPIKDLEDFQFYLFLRFHQRNSFRYFDEDFIKLLIQKKLELKSTKLQDFLRHHIALVLADNLVEIWNQNNVIGSLVEELNFLIESFSHKQDFGKYTVEFILEPPSFTELVSTNIHSTIFDVDSQKFIKIAEALLPYNKDNYDEMNRWYSALYTKIAEYQKIHNSALLPLVNPEKFAEYKKPIYHIIIPLETKIQQWESEALKNLKTKQKNSPALSVPSAPSLIEQNLSQNTNNNTNVEVKIENVEPFIETSKTLSHPIKIVPSQEIQKKAENSFDLFINSSPFPVKKRILDWYGLDKSKLSLQNAESPLIHNFAWAANDILWEFGLKYSRKDDKGNIQPAIAMLCNLEHANIPKQKSLFRFTATFDHTISEGSDLKTFDPTWICYHRTLTRREQNEEIVEDYIQNGKYQCVDFPPLLSQRIQVEIPESLKGKSYPDGSFIESVEGSTITIRDPKNDEGNIKCRLHLFVVR